MATPTLIAITREAGASLAACEFTHVARTLTDAGLPARQHE